MFDINKPTILLNSHIDTVKLVSGWRNSRLLPKWKRELYGLGSNDAGASLVSLFQVYRHLSMTTQSYNLIFLAFRRRGIRKKRYWKRPAQLPPIALGVVGEPMEYQTCHQKGTYGSTSQHVENPDTLHVTGENAIYKLLPDIEWFRTYKFPKNHPFWDLSKWVSPDQCGHTAQCNSWFCSIVVDIRSNECYLTRSCSPKSANIYRVRPKHALFRLNSSSIRLIIRL